METLKAFRDMNSVDTVIAYSVEDAYKVWEEHNGANWDEEVGEDAGWYELDNEKIQTIIFDDPIHIPVPPESTIENDGKFCKKVTAKIGEWITANGRGFLCSSEW